MHRQRRSNVADLRLTLLVLAACGVMVGGCKRSKPAVPIVRMAAAVGNAEAPIIGIYINPHRISPEGLVPQVIVAIWEDGQIVWSKDRLMGGPPYFSGKIPPKRIEGFFKELSKTGTFKDPIRKRSLVRFDSDHMVIGVSRGRERVSMQSDHELAETNPNLVGTAHGILVLEGRSRAEVSVEQPKWYKRFREIWADIRKAADALIPDEGEPAKDLHFETRYLGAEPGKWPTAEELVPSLPEHEGSTPEHDAAGNLTKDASGNSYFYDAENRLTRIDNSSSFELVRYSYDAFGRRIVRRIPTGRIWLPMPVMAIYA